MVLLNDILLVPGISPALLLDIRTEPEWVFDLESFDFLFVNFPVGLQMAVHFLIFIVVVDVIKILIEGP